MRFGAVLTMAILLAATSARAQGYSPRDDNSHRFVKILVGAGALAIGTAVAATSSKTTTVTGTLGTMQTSEFSTSQLVTGIAIAGVGGIVLWDGVRDHGPNRPSVGIGVGFARQTGRVFVRKTW
jgi:hypothetical protein